MEPEDFPLPEWIQSAWNRLGSGDLDDDVESALAMWHQGILLTPEHPSMAFVAYIASVEAVAGWLESRGAIRPFDAPCEHCGHVPGAAGRFWAAIEYVAEPGQVGRLREARVYDLRSGTAHGSLLHGIEKQFGSQIFLPANLEDPVQKFNLDTLGRMRIVSRQLLLRVLATEEEPE